MSKVMETYQPPKKKSKKQKREERFVKAWGRKPKGKVNVGRPKYKKDTNKKFELTDEVKKQYEELAKEHHIDNPSTEECPYF